MERLIDNWYLILAFFALGAAVGGAVYHFFKLPTKQQIANIKEWLKIAVLEAEKELGRKTGQAKLRLVYDMAISKFSWLSFISFDVFSKWVDDALEWLNEQMKSNDAIATYIEK